MKSIREVANHLLLSSVFLAPFLANSVSAQGAGQRTFSSSNDALTALIKVVRGGNPSELVAILGPGSEQIASSSDSVADKAGRESFIKWYDEGHSLVPSTKGEFTLQVGKDGWPLPIPLVHSGDKWYWDGAAGKEEILYRRIGHNELAAINVCHGIVDAQRDYAASPHDGQPAGSYAKRIVSEPGKQNGVYWQVKEGQPESPAGPMLAEAAEEGYDTSGNHTPYHGYYYRMLPGASGFGFVAFPADYRSSGVMTFLVNQKGIIYQKDLGAKTSELAQQMVTFSLDKSWQPVK
ncbi:MAG TPA: DUF2950 domain-containing protein [Edaphobacter sp.]|jgi:hypothetical protein|nr:DUF2950 domain-containing protein [Edaphobacter sp.]